VPREGAVAPIRSDPNPGVLRSVLHWGYDAAWCGAAVVGLPWLAWRSLRDRGFARMVLERLGVGLPELGGPGADRRILVHGVSVGEIKGALPLVRALEAAHPEYEIVVSATTNTGIQVAHSLFPERQVVRFPADLSGLVGRFLRRIRPACIVLLELEIWPNFLRAANRSGIPVAVVNGRITDRSHGRYRLFRRTMPQFNRISLFCVQVEEYAARFRSLAIDPARVVLTGNIKADGLRVGRVDAGDELRRLLGARDGRPVLVAGSTHHPEERHVVQAWREGAPEARLVVVPRHPERCPELVRSLAGMGARPQLLTVLRRGGEPPDPDRPVLVDTIGELERVYGLADVVFVGGSLIPHGGQNMLEPAAQGLPVVFGPHVENFAQEAVLLLGAGAAVQLAGPAELAGAVRRLFADPALREGMSRAGRDAVETHKGATELTLRALDATCLGELREPAAG